MNEPVGISVLMTSHNRCSKTLLAMASVQASARSSSRPVDLSIVLVDAGSTDGTREAVAEQFPEVNVVEADGDVYWGTGMSLAGGEARKSDSDFHLWLNDDVSLNLGALELLLATSGQFGGRAIVVGQLVGTEGAASYGGFCRGSGLQRLRFTNVGVTDAPTECDTVNGNVVLVPREVRESIGDVDERFPHAFGDIDYGLRARSAGFQVVQAPGVVGKCDRNPPVEAASRARERLRSVASVKRLPRSAWWEFCRRHGGALAPLHFVKPYAGALLPQRRRT